MTPFPTDRQFYIKHYLSDQTGHGLPYFKGTVIQQGYGLGGIFAGLARGVIPALGRLVSSGARAILPALGRVAKSGAKRAFRAGTSAVVKRIGKAGPAGLLKAGVKAAGKSAGRKLLSQGMKAIANSLLDDRPSTSSGTGYPEGYPVGNPVDRKRRQRHRHHKTRRYRRNAVADSDIFD